MDKSEKNEIIKEKHLEKFRTDRVTQKPPVHETEITKALIESGMPIISNTNMLPGTIKYDTPHLSRHNKTENFLVALLPFNIQNQVKDLFERKFPDYTGEGKGTVFFNGHIHAENIFYKRIEELDNVKKYPEILISCDINSTFYKPELLNENNFESFRYSVNKAFSGTNIENAYKVIRFLAADAMVMLIDRSKYMQSQAPCEWYELLHPALEQGIAFCGETDYFCDTVYAHFVRDFGLKAVEQLKNNTLCRMHPVEMLRELKAGNKNGAKVYVIPYSYARMVENIIDFQVIRPRDGAIILPVQMLVKKGCSEKHKELINFMTGSEMGRLFALNGFVPINKNVECNIPDNSLNWIGWDFLKNENFPELKRNINQLLNNGKSQNTY
ncbi:MAG: ABC transporter substrate-binding protein [Paludibacter sp.]|nr:ABC transporter substrate-binding protein [Paludibacter sp.]